MELENAITGRRTVRLYKNKKVPRKIIEKLIEAATWAPSACNRQLWDFIIIDRHELKEKVHRIVKQKQVLAAPVVILVTYDTTKSLPGSNLEHYQSAAAAIQNLLLMAHSKGLGACWMAGIGDLQAIRALFGLPEAKQPIAFVTLGYPDESPRAAARRPFSEIVHYNSYSGVSGKNYRDPSKWTLKRLADFQQQICRYGDAPERCGEHQLQSLFKRCSNAVSAIPKDSKVLDVYPYAGLYLNPLVERFGKNVTTLSLSKEASELLKERYPGLTSGVSCAAFPFKDSSFDLVTCIHRLERVPDPEWLLREIHRVCKTGGRLIIATENKLSLSGLGTMVLSLFPGWDVIEKYECCWSIGPKRHFTPWTLRRLFRKSGFEVASWESFSYVPEKMPLINRYWSKFNGLFAFVSGAFERLPINGGKVLFITLRKK